MKTTFLSTLSSFALIFNVMDCVAAEEIRGSAPQPLAPAFPSYQSGTNEFPGVSDEPAAGGKPVRDADDRFEGSWDLNVSFRRPLNGDYVAVHRATTTFNILGTARSWIGLELGGGVLELERGTWASAVARDPVVLEGGLVFRQHFTEPEAFLRPYLALGLSWFVFIWDYREPIVTDDETIHTDYVWGIDPSVALGITLQPTRRLNVFGEIEAGGMLLPESATERNVENNFFDSFGYVGIKAGLRLKF
jgi:hypothetical protein